MKFSQVSNVARQKHMQLTALYNNANKRILWNVLFKIVGGLILAILIASFTSCLNQVAEQRNLLKTEQSIVNTLCIGTNKEYVDTCLGAPFIKYLDSETNIEDCLYKASGAIVRVFYQNECAKGIFITLTDPNFVGQYAFEQYLNKDQNQKIGTFIYDDIDGYCEGNYFQHTNGIDIAFYIERYYYHGWGGYHSYFYASLPYGMYLEPAEETKNSIVHYSIVAGQQGNEYPNSIGVVQEDFRNKICDLVLDTGNFDYISIELYRSQMEESLLNTNRKNEESTKPFPSDDYYNSFEMELDDYRSKKH